MRKRESDKDEIPEQRQEMAFPDRNPQNFGIRKAPLKNGLVPCCPMPSDVPEKRELPQFCPRNFVNTNGIAEKIMLAP